MDYILKYRSHLMGLAILWVVLFHMQIKLPGELLEFIRITGYGGVDIFFFLSGIGVFYSLRKNSVKEFYMRRIKRIMPAYVPIVILTFVLYNARRWQGMSFAGCINWMKQLTGNLFMVGWFNQTEGQFNWYVQAIMWFYLAAPLFVSGICKIGSDKKKMALLWLALLLVQFPFMGTVLHKMPARLLIFTLGIYLIWCYEGGGRKKYFQASACVLSIVGIGILHWVYVYVPDWLEMYGLYWFPFVLIVPGVCVMLSKVVDMLSKHGITKQLMKALESIGKASFEIYLTHILLFDFVIIPLELHGRKVWFFCAILAIVAGILYKRAVSTVTKKMKLV